MTLTKQLWTFSYLLFIVAGSVSYVGPPHELAVAFSASLWMMGSMGLVMLAMPKLFDSAHFGFELAMLSAITLVFLIRADADLDVGVASLIVLIALYHVLPVIAYFVLAVLGAVAMALTATLWVSLVYAVLILPSLFAVTRREFLLDFDTPSERVGFNVALAVGLVLGISL